MALAVGQDRDVAGEERPVRAGEVEQHRVVPGDGETSTALLGRIGALMAVAAAVDPAGQPPGVVVRTASGSSVSGTSW